MQAEHKPPVIGNAIGNGDTQTPSEETSSEERAPAPAWLMISRTVALFVGGFTLLNLFGELRSEGFDANIWWIDLRPLPPAAARGVLAFSAVLFVAFAIMPAMNVFRRRLTVIVGACLFAAVLWNAFQFYSLLQQGEIRSQFPIPFSLHVAAALAVMLAGVTSGPWQRAHWFRDGLVGLFTLSVCATTFPLAQMYCFGNTDYRREADVAVVFGCRAYADGTPSTALDQRVRTGCKLYVDGYVRKLIFSGGPGDGDVHETEAMRRLAVTLGVPEFDILVDSEGLNTEATVENTKQLFAQHHTDRVLVVSHFYHLPRIKLSYHRQGIEVFTVPAQQEVRLKNQWYLLVRETAAFWLYYVRPLA